MWKHYLNEHETSRLLIRPLISDDYLVWQDFIMDETATRFFPDEWKLKPGKSTEWINSQLTRYKEKRYGLQALIDKKTGKFIGQCGLLTQTVDDKNELEIGYHLIPRYWGKGFATEAAMEFKRMGFENKLADSIISIININNTPSQKVAKRNGMTREKRTRFFGLDVFIYRILKEDYLKNSKD